MIITEDEVYDLIGKFIIEINNDEPTIDITKSSNDGFWIEKRINFVSRDTNGFGVHSLYGAEWRKSKPVKEFVKWFNNEDNNKRHHRLLTTKELKWLFKIMIKRNY